jgi:hypothetical protein
MSAGMAASAFGQAAPTATAGLQLSAFGGASGVYIGMGRNLSITAGFDATLRPFFGFFPGVEIRGTYPVKKGVIDSQKNVLGGLVLTRPVRRLQLYGDLLVGRGEIDFVQPYPNPADTEIYVQTASTVISPGAGVNFSLSDRFAIKGDFQFQRYQTPVTTSGSAYAKALTIGLVYRLPFGGLGQGRRFR